MYLLLGVAITNSSPGILLKKLSAKLRIFVKQHFIIILSLINHQYAYVTYFNPKLCVKPLKFLTISSAQRQACLHYYKGMSFGYFGAALVHK